MEALGQGVDGEVFLVHAAFPRVVQVLGVHDAFEVLDRLEQRAGFAAQRDFEQQLLVLTHRVQAHMLEPVDECPHVLGADLPANAASATKGRSRSTMTPRTRAVAWPEFIRSWLRTHAFNVEAPSSSKSLDASSSANNAAWAASTACCTACRAWILSRTSPEASVRAAVRIASTTAPEFIP